LPGSPKHHFRDWIIVGLITFSLAEVVVRLVQSPSVNGRRTFLGQPLLPYQLDLATALGLTQGTRGEYLIPDAQLGWTIAPSTAQGVYQSNSQAVRASGDRIYAPVAPPGKVRILAVGDSFTHCDEVLNDETWEAALERLRGDVEVVNLGLPMSGTDQALLRYRRDGLRFAPQITILGIWTENICRNLSLIYYYFNPYLGAGSRFVSKPRFLLGEGKLRLINSPVLSAEQVAELLARPRAHPLLKYDYWYSESETEPKFYQRSAAIRAAESIYNLYARKRRREQLYRGINSIGIDLTVAIAKEFAAVAWSSGSQPIFLLVPMQHHLREKEIYSTKDSFPLAKALRREGLEVIDLGYLFTHASPPVDIDSLFLRQGGHMSAEANRLIARMLEPRLGPFIEKAKQARSEQRVDERRQGATGSQ